ncbi:MAG: 3-dehydroquinate synthase [Gammaproteobacteria bacterium]
MLTITARNHTYPIYIGSGLLSSMELLNKHIIGNQVMVVTNETVAKYYLTSFLHNFTDKQCNYIVLPDGETYKNIASWSTIIDALLANKHRRSTTLIALGGGVVGDITGFVAACYQRGVNYIQVPTTLLAQVDSSIGGKTAVNHSMAKNMIGTFYPPMAVFTDTDTLKTLPKREFISGLAEIIKHALIADADFFSRLETNINKIMNQDMSFLTSVIIRSCEIKASIVGQDEFEQGKRALLNFGHTFAHAIESLTNYNTFLHGEAVAIGMVLACRLAVNMGYFSNTATERVIAFLLALDLPISLPVVCKPEAMLHEMQLDKKATDSGLSFIVLNSIGEATRIEKVSTDIVMNTLKNT